MNVLGPRSSRPGSVEGLSTARAFACPPEWGTTPRQYLASPAQAPWLPCLAQGVALAALLVAFAAGAWALVPVAVAFGLLGAALRRGSGQERDAGEVVVLWDERGVSPETLATLRDVEAHLASGAAPPPLDLWWSTVSAAVAEQSLGPGEPYAADLVAAAGSVDAAALWHRARERHERVATAWTDLVCDPLSALTHCSLFDITNPTTAAFIEAYGEAGDFISVHGTDAPVQRAVVDEYAELARAVESAWEAARTRAGRSGYDWLPEDQRDDAERAARLLALASSESAPLAERASAAERASTLLRRIHAVVLPDATMQALEAVRRPELEGPELEGPDPAAT